MTIPTYRLPAAIERGASGGPEWSTVVQEAISGKEQRIRQWTVPRAKYDISYGLRESSDWRSDFRAVLAVFMAHRGKAYPFRFRDWSDYQADLDEFAIGDGVETEFQIKKAYNPGTILLGFPTALYYHRDITCIDGDPEIYVNGVLTTALSISDTGLITFDSAPADAASIRWIGEFDIPVRFDTDYLPSIMDVNDLMGIQSIPLREVLGET